MKKSIIVDKGKNRKGRLMLPRFFSFVLLIGLAIGTPARAAVIYSQTTPAEPLAAFGAVNTLGTDLVQGDYGIADNFVFGGATPQTVRSVRLVGSAFSDATTLYPNYFRIAFFNDANGLPDDLLPDGEFLVTNNVRQRLTGERLLNGVYEPVEYEVDLGSGITLQPDTQYWVSVSNRPNFDRNWAWARAAGVLDQVIASTRETAPNDIWQIGTSGGGMWFELRTTNVPEPSSWPLVLPALLLATTAVARKRSNDGAESSNPAGRQHLTPSSAYRPRRR